MRLFAIIYFLSFLLSDIYGYSFIDYQGGEISLSEFRGKKILIVNTASRGKYADQLFQLEELYQQYNDSLVIITIPSDSFGNEPNTDQQIAEHLIPLHFIHYYRSKKLAVNGAEKMPLYKWLTSADENGAIDGNVVEDFQKYLINEEGKLVGVFAGSVAPTDEKLRNAINTK